MVRIARREHSHPADDEGNTAIASGCNTDALGGVRVPASCRCIADKCAMWRWGAWDEKPVRRIEQGHFNTSSPGDPITCREVTAMEKVPTHGYCGLASTQAP